MGPAVRIAEGVDANDGVLAGVLEHLVVHALFLDLAALVARFHRTQYAAALGDLFELGQDGFLHQLGELVDHEGALVGVLVLGQSPLTVDDELDRHGAPHALLGGRGDGLIVGVGVQRVAVVVDGNQGLQRGADVVERNLLCMQRTPRRLDVVLELL
jgi:hypothetical protein